MILALFIRGFFFFFVHEICIDVLNAMFFISGADVYIVYRKWSKM